MDKKRRDQENMDLGFVQIMKTTSFLSKDHNWKSPGIVKYKITGFKHSQLPTGILQTVEGT